MNKSFPTKLFHISLILKMLSLAHRQQFYSYRWLILLVSCIPFLPPLHTHSIPVQLDTSAEYQHQCQHDTIPDLIKRSPVILKALGARIFTEYEVREGLAIWPGFTDEKDFKFVAMENVIRRRQSSDDEMTATKGMSTTAATMPTRRTTTKATAAATATTATRNAEKLAITMPTRKAKNAAESIVITLTPETIYKGASLLKMSPSPDNGGSTASSSESSYQYEGQLNATLKPLACFDGKILRLLPAKLIVFGKLVNEQPDILRISINGLHRWSSQFENHIWKYLGWDDWSDFTLCSVTCGKGVQQRFRRCLLDNPLININMNRNRYDNIGPSMDIDMVVEEMDTNRDNDLIKSDFNEINSTNDDDDDDDEDDDATSTLVQHYHHHRNHHRSKNTKNSPATVDNDDGEKEVEEGEADNIRIFDGNRHRSFPSAVTSDNEIKKSTRHVSTSTNQGDDDGSSISSNKLKKRRKRKKASKSLSTMSCEGYNIEQRNCNTFECSDDLSDLLKFYKKFLLAEDLTTSAAAAVTMAPSTIVDGSGNSQTHSTTTGDVPSLVTPSTLTPSSSTPANMGYVKSWRNTLNFTLMVTLRVKNDTKSASTIFSVRNATHNLYLEPSPDGLRLYQERDGTTEMLPVKFNLYDNRWHQIAISIQNGDFISIFVDCLWTNSFVVSKRLFSLPNDADVEIGRGFNGELQQLLVLPENQERLQCSSQRTSINEVKRYIIDTFIDDYGN